MLLVQMIDRLMYLIKLTKYSGVGFFFFFSKVVQKIGRREGKKNVNTKIS